MRVAQTYVVHGSHTRELIEPCSFPPKAFLPSAMCFYFVISTTNSLDTSLRSGSEWREDVPRRGGPAALGDGPVLRAPEPLAHARPMCTVP